MVSVNLCLAKYLNVLYTLKTRPRLYPKTQTFPESPPRPHTWPRIWPRGGPSGCLQCGFGVITFCKNQWLQIKLKMAIGYVL